MKCKSMDCHRYRKTHGFEVTGFVGICMVVDFSTPWHTTYSTHTAVLWVFHRYITQGESNFINLFFLILNHCFCIVSHCGATKYGYASHPSSFVFVLTLTHSHLTSRKQSKLQFYVSK